MLLLHSLILSLEEDKCRQLGFTQKMIRFKIIIPSRKNLTKFPRDLLVSEIKKGGAVKSGQIN